MREAPERPPRVGSPLFLDTVYSVLLLGPIVYVILRYAIGYGTFEFNSSLLGKNVFWILATIPALAAVVHFLVHELPRHHRRVKACEEFFSVDAADTSGFRSKDFSKLLARYATEAEGIRPYFSGVLFGSACFVLVFGTAAALSKGSTGIGVSESIAPLKSAAPAERRPSPPTSARRGGETAIKPGPAEGPAEMPPAPGTATTPASGAPSGAASAGEPAGTKDAKAGAATPEQQETTGARAQPTSSPSERDAEGRRGLVFAAYGAYVYVIRLFIGRLNSSGLSGKFLLRLALRGAIALVLGYSAGALGIFTAVAEGGPSLFAYFCVGLFPAWAMSALQQRGRKLFVPDEPGCSALPLCLVDGLDDDVSDRLVEIGISDVQHLAYSSPFEVMLRTDFPQNRILDWTDQSLLINYTRDKIVHFRKLGLRGSIEMAVLYGDFVKLMPDSDEDAGSRQERAKTLLQNLAQRTEIPEFALLTIGRSLFEDQHVNLIWDLWQHVPSAEGDGEETPAEQKDGSAAERPERSEPSREAGEREKPGGDPA